jgi:hypothetical protein
MLRFLETVRQSFLKEVMRVIKSDTGFLYYEKIFKQLMNNQSPLVVWQLSREGERQITHTLLNSYHMESGKLFFDIESKEKVQEDLPIYCYAEAGPLIFKAEIQDLYETNISVNMPQEIKILEDAEAILIKGNTGEDLSDVWKVKRLEIGPIDTSPDIMKVKSMSERSTRDQDLLNNEFGLSVDEEDKLFAEKRESPRARPKIDKWVKVAKLAGNGPEMFKLFDLSRGGLGFVAFSETEFTKGSEIHIVGFNDFDLDDPLVGKIMSLRPIDGTQSEFKIGVKFSEGQD